MLLLLLLLSHFSHIRLYATPQTPAHHAPPSLGFSRQEHWSGLPFPSPMHEGEKWKWSRSVMPNSLQPHGLQPTRLLRPWDFPGKSTGVGCHFLLQLRNIIFTKICFFLKLVFTESAHVYGHPCEYEGVKGSFMSQILMTLSQPKNTFPHLMLSMLCH